MFSLAMLTKEAPAAPPQAEEAPVASLHHAFAPVLAAAPVVEEQRARVSGWVFVAAFVAFIAPVITVVAVFETRTAAPRSIATTPTATTVGSTITETSERTETTPTATTSAIESAPRDKPVHHTPHPRPIPTTTATTVRNEAPKCCPGETEMQCAMRRSVGATCG